MDSVYEANSRIRFKLPVINLPHCKRF